MASLIAVRTSRSEYGFPTKPTSSHRIASCLARSSRFPLTNKDGLFQRCLRAAALSTPFEPRARLMSMIATSIPPSTLSASASACGIPRPGRKRCGQRPPPGKPEAAYHESPLRKLEHLLHKPVAFLVVTMLDANVACLRRYLHVSVFREPDHEHRRKAFVGKLVGVLGTVAVLVKLSVADLPAQASPPFPILLNSALALLPISEASACECGGGLILAP
jgi:hypothetical protein